MSERCGKPGCIAPEAPPAPRKRQHRHQQMTTAPWSLWYDCDGNECAGIDGFGYQHRDAPDAEREQAARRGISTQSDDHARPACRCYCHTTAGASHIAPCCPDPPPPAPIMNGLVSMDIRPNVPATGPNAGVAPAPRCSMAYGTGKDCPLHGSACLVPPPEPPRTDEPGIVYRGEPGALPEPTHSVGEEILIVYDGKSFDLPICCFCDKPWTHGGRLRLHEPDEPGEIAWEGPVHRIKDPKHGVFDGWSECRVRTHSYPDHLEHAVATIRRKA